MSKEQLKTKLRENAVAYLVVLLLGSGGGSLTTAMRGPDGNELAAIHEDLEAMKVATARMSQKLDDFIEHSRDLRRSSIGAAR